MSRAAALGGIDPPAGIVAADPGNPFAAATVLTHLSL